jgi:hypothetical protein
VLVRFGAVAEPPTPFRQPLSVVDLDGRVASGGESNREPGA